MNGYDRIVSRSEAAGEVLGDFTLADPETEAAIWRMGEEQPDWGPRTVADELTRQGMPVSYEQVRSVLG